MPLQLTSSLLCATGPGHNAGNPSRFAASSKSPLAPERQVRWAPLRQSQTMKHCPNPDCDHLVRYGRVAEFLDKMEACSDCGASLDFGEAPQPAYPTYRELVTIYKTSDGIQAHLVRSALEQEGIPVSIRGEALMGAIGELPATMLDVEVQVPPEFAVWARELALECERDTDEEPV